MVIDHNDLALVAEAYNSLADCESLHNVNHRGETEGRLLVHIEKMIYILEGELPTPRKQSEPA